MAVAIVKDIGEQYSDTGIGSQIYACIKRAYNSFK